ncbi:PLP-dependent aminotransferase family protein [Aneurinibacillus terranovensis]|uniref:aminotransferase-like domain-containing protein n=1 Tax=Aneurinibacillus terranovensis TaxID=278991 RepID=UPI001FE0EDE2|nr:PLP-dependent aminotransferase family protein [Aneurinibacillus terranovensis]
MLAAEGYVSASVGRGTYVIFQYEQQMMHPGEKVIVENPCYTGVKNAINAVGGIPVPCAVDVNGIIPVDWNARLLFVTPSRQYPTGTVLSLERRQAILRWASERQAVIVEDDYDSEFRHRGRPVEPLKVLDKGGRVIYIGTFSKTILPDFRVGYAVLPPSLTETFCKAQQLFEPHTPSLLEQRALTSFMNSGLYQRHLRRVRRVYSQKYEVMRHTMKEKLPHLFELVDSDAGLHIFARLREGIEKIERVWNGKNIDSP